MYSLTEQIECIKNMLLPRKTDYYFESYNVSNIASPVTNNVRNSNGPRYKKLWPIDFSMQLLWKYSS